MKTKVCFIGGARYSQPLDATSAKKFRLLSELGEIFVISFAQDLHLRRFTEHAHFYLLPQFPLPVLRYLTMFTVGPLLALWLILRYKVLILVAQSPYEGFTAAMAKRIARLIGKRVALIVESHGDFEVSLFLQRRIRLPSLYRFLMRCAAHFAFRHADVLRAVSASTRAQLEKWRQGKPLLQFPTWTDIEVFLDTGGKKECADHTQEIIYAGVLISLKGVHFLIETFARVAPQFPEAKLIIIGKPEDKEYARSLQEQVKRLGLDGRVIFFGAMSQKELAERMTRACVLVLPSLSEGLPRVVFEAMACGTPVIGSFVGGIPEMVEDGVTGFLVPPGDTAALTERLRWILSHPEEAQAMGQRARDFAKRFFSPQAYKENYIWLFQMAEQVVKGNEATPV